MKIYLSILLILMIYVFQGCNFNGVKISDNSIVTRKLLQDAALNHWDRVKDILEEVSELKKPNSTNESGYTLLALACFHDDSELIKQIIKLGADVNFNIITSKRVYQYPIHIASQYSSYEVLEILLNKGALVDAVDYVNRTALFYAVNEYRKTELLLKHGANPNHESKYGWFPLHYALMCPQKPPIETIRLLLEFGANPNKRVENPVFADSSLGTRKRHPVGFTPLEIAKDGGYDDIVNLLKQYGANE